MGLTLLKKVIGRGQIFGKTLKRLDMDRFENFEYIGFYFANDTEECREMTQKLINLYNDIKSEHKLEIVFIYIRRRIDEEEKCEELYNDMPWLAARHENSQVLAEFRDEYKHGLEEMNAPLLYIYQAKESDSSLFDLITKDGLDIVNEYAENKCEVKWSAEPDEPVEPSESSD